MSRSNFQRSQSKVWFGNEPDGGGGGSFGGIIGGAFAGFRPYGAATGSYQYHHGFGGAPLLSSRMGYPSFHDLEEEDELIEEEQQQEEKQKKQQPTRNNDWAEANRQGSPASHKSQDSGFSDTETSPNAVGGHSKGNVSSSLSINDSQNATGEKLTPKRSVDEELLFQRSPSLNSGAPTPPTVIRRPLAKQESVNPSQQTTNGRRLSFSEPTSLTSSIDSEAAKGESSHRDGEGSVRSGGSTSLKRGRVITKNSRVKRNLNEQLSHSSEEMISLDGSELSEMLNQTNCSPGEQVSLNGSYTSVLGTPKGILKPKEEASQSDANNNLHQDEAFKREGRELPTYAQLYPAGTSTPIKHQSKLYRSLPLSPSHRTASPRELQHVKPASSPSGSTTTVVENFYDEPDHLRDSTTASEHAFSYTIYDNPLLNGHTPAVQSWLDGLRFACQSEVMSILQTKSIAAEAGRTTRMTSAVAVKIIRHLQTKVTTLQGAFERVEKLFAAIKRYQAQQDNDEDDEEDEKEIYQKVAPFVHGLASDIYEFVQKQKGNDYFGREQVEKDDRRKFLENAQSLVDMTSDLRAAAANADEFDYRSVEEEVQIVKRYFLITVRLIFKNLVKVIVDTVETAKCDLILRSNLSYVAMLSNLDYNGLASLNDAFIANYTVRALLLVCVESKFSSIRALALRALATVCSTTETIRQLERADGLEVLRDILVVDQKQQTNGTGTNERTEPELRETVSVLTQITAPWHGEDHRLEGLKQHVHSIVEAITEIIERTTCCQTLLLCSACLNNMTRIEPTAVYSLMAQDTVAKLKTATEQRGPGTSIFLYEQFTSMLYNMSANWKCHHHLASRPLVAFLVALFSQKFYEKLPSRTESEAQRKTIKNVLHVLSRLMSGGSLVASSPATLELLESTLVPVFARIERTLDGASEHYRDISSINRWFNESVTSRHGSSPTVVVPVGEMAKDRPVAPHITRLTVRRDPVNGAVITLDKNRQESYV